MRARGTSGEDASTEENDRVDVEEGERGVETTVDGGVDVRASTVDAGGRGVEDAGEEVAVGEAAEAEREEEYEEYEEEVDYTLGDHVADAVRAVEGLKPDFTWSSARATVEGGVTSGRVDFLSGRRRTGEGLDAHSAVGTILALVSFWSARAIRLELEKRDKARAVAGGEREMTEEERMRAAELRRERLAREAEAERDRRAKRDAEEAAERARLEEMARLQAEAEAKAAEEEAKRREEMRAELRRRNAEEKARLEARLKAEAEAKAAQLAAERAEREQKRLEREKAEAEELARRQVICDERGEKELTVSADTEVIMKRDNATAPVDVVVTARVGISAGATERASFRSADEARVAALPLCSTVAAKAMVAYASDARLQDMMGNGPLSRLPGMDDLEFEHWTRVMQARMDSEMRTAIVRCGAALEVKLREEKRGGSEKSKATTRFKRRSLPVEDEENIVRRMETAVDCVAGEIIEELDGPSGGCDAAADILAGVEFYELGQLHGLHPSIVFPAEHPKTGLSGELMASMLTLSHFINRANRAYEDDPRVGERARQLAATLVGRSASKQGSWRAMYLDGFTGDALTAASAMADTVLPEDDAIRAFLNGAVEEQRRRMMGEERTYEEEWPDAEKVRKMRLKEMRDNQPITERLFALRTAALQLAQSGSKDQARKMLEEALEIRKNDVAKNNKDPENTAETLPELIALSHVLDSREAWTADLRSLRREVLKCVRIAVDEIASEGDIVAAAALLESALHEYEPFLGADDDRIMEYRSFEDDLWSRAGVNDDERESAVANIAGSAGAIAMITAKYTKEIETRRRPGG